MALRTIYSFLTSASAVSASGGFNTDYRFDDGTAQRTLFGTLTGGAEVNLYFSITDPTTGITIRHLETTISAGSSTFSSATNSFADAILSPVTRIEVVKANASGIATVIGIL